MSINLTYSSDLSESFIKVRHHYANNTLIVQYDIFKRYSGKTLMIFTPGGLLFMKYWSNIPINQTRHPHFGGVHAGCKAALPLHAGSRVKARESSEILQNYDPMTLISATTNAKAIPAGFSGFQNNRRTENLLCNSVQIT